MTLGNIFSGFLLNPLATRKGVRQKPRSDQGVLTVRVGTPRAPPQCLNRMGHLSILLIGSVKNGAIGLSCLGRAGELHQVVDQSRHALAAFCDHAQ